MRHTKSIVFIFTFLLTFTACNSTKSISGIYQSKFAVIGFFGTLLTLRNDSTFGYRMRGDLIGDTATGKYKVENSFLILSYDLPKVDTALQSSSDKQSNWTVNPLATLGSSNRPKMFLIGHNKLFVSDTLGNVYKTEKGYSRHKKFLLWGQQYMTKRRYYLKRLD